MASRRQKGGRRSRQIGHGSPLQHGQFDVVGMRAAQNEKMIREFKTMPCNYRGNPSLHDVRCCPFYHSERDRRRPVVVDGQELRYAADPCSEQFDDQGRCSRGDACGFCHNTAELLYHPDIFHKRLCQGKWCPRGSFCAFAHSRTELLVPHFSEVEEGELSNNFMMHKFKTLWCPLGEPHNWETCVYAHTYRDWRRLPSVGYSSRPCPAWSHSLALGSDLVYAERCRLGFACPLAHGAKEQLYHPDFYKTNPCDNPRCSKRVAMCAFMHDAGDMRRMPTTVAPQRKTALARAEEYLSEHQPTFQDPPKYLSLEDAAHSTGNSPTGNSSRYPTTFMPQVSSHCVPQAASGPDMAMPACSMYSTPFASVPEPNIVAPCVVNMAMPSATYSSCVPMMSESQFPIQNFDAGYTPIVFVQVFPVAQAVSANESPVVFYTTDGHPNWALHDCVTEI